MSPVGRNGHRKDRNLGEFWERQFCYLVQKYGWDIKRSSQKNGHMYKDKQGQKYIAPDAWSAKRDNMEFAYEVKHKNQTGYKSYGFEDYRIDSLLKLQSNAGCIALYVIHDWEIAFGEKGKWVGYTNEPVNQLIPENKEEHWFARELDFLEKTNPYISYGPTYYGGETVWTDIHYYEAAHFLPLTKFIMGAKNPSHYPLLLRFPAGTHIAAPTNQWGRDTDGSILATFISQSELAWCLIASGIDESKMLPYLKDTTNV